MKKYAVLLSAILAIAVVGCEKLNIESTDQDSSWKLVKSSGDTTVIQKNDTIHDSIIVVDSLVLTTKSYQVLRDDVVVYEIEVNSDKSTVGVFDFDRAYGVANGIRREILVKSESKLNGVRYLAGSFSSDNTAWKSGSYWSGQKMTGKQSFKMANDSVSANFVDTYYSSSVKFEKDTLSLSFPSLNWTSSYALDSTSVYNKSNGDSLFKVKDFITTTTFVAEVNPNFVKEGSVSKKSFEVRDTLSLMYFVEPDPEDEVVGLRAYGSVEKRNGIIYGVARWYEIHTLIDSVLVKTQEQAFNATLTAKAGEVVYASDAKYQTIGNGWSGNGEATYDNDATNGAEPFANTYNVSADKDYTMSFNGIEITFTTEFVLSEAGQTIGNSELVNVSGVHYDVYPYSNKVNGKYTVKCGNESQSVEMSATANREIRVKAADVITEGVENQSFVAEFVTEGNTLSTKTYYNQWDYVEYNYGLEILRNNVKHNLNLSAEITGAAPFDVLSKDDLTKEYKITDIRKTSNESEKVEENGFRFEREIRFFDVTVNNGQTLKVKVITEKDLTPEVNLGYMSLVDVQNGGVETTVNGNTIVLKPAVKVLLQENYATIASKTQTRGAATVESKAYTISTEMVGKYQPSIDTVRVPDIKNNVPTVETYVVTDGDSTLIETESYNPYCSLTANNGNDVIAENYNFTTTFNGVSNEFTASIQDGNFFITRASGDVKSTMNNGTLSADNEGKYTFDKVMTYKNGNDEFIFNGGVLFTISTEDITFAGEKTVEEITYNAYDYKTTFNMVYYVDSVKVAEKSAPVSRNILVAKKAEDAVIDTVAYGMVEKRNGVIYGIAKWYERHTLIDSVLVKTQEQAFNATISGEKAEAMYASNANYQTIGNGWSGNGEATYDNDATNGAEPFANTYKVSADKGMTMSFGGIEVVFTTEMIIKEAGQTIGNSELVNINNVHYDVYPYSNKVNGVYTVSCGKDAQSVEMSATANREIRVKAADVITEGIENQQFVAEFVAEGAKLSTKTYYNQWDYATYNYGMETSREGFKHNLNVSAEITGAEDFKVQDKADLTKEYKITSIAETANESEQVEEDGVRKERTTRFFNATVNNGKTLQVKVITEKDLTPDVNLGYMSLVDVQNGGVETTVNGNNVSLKPAVKVLLQENYATTASKAPLRGATAAAASNVKSYTISTEMVGTYTPQVDTVRVPKYNGNPTVETYVVTDGDSVLVKTETYAPYFAINANNGSDVIASDYAFVTTFDGTSGETIKSIKDGNFYVTRVSGNIKSHMSNGTVNANNEGQYAYDKVVTYKNGNDNFIFNAVVNFTENTDLIVANGEKTVEDVVYNAYAYKTTFNMSYSCAGYADAKSASVSRNILVAKEVEDLVPGTIASMAITAVPAHWTGGGFADGSGHQQAIKGLAIITTDGKGCYIPFAGADDSNVLMPANEAISGANYVDGGYDASYNSGYYRDGQGWKPAIMSQNGAQILYYDHGSAVRSLTQKSLSTWSWRNGNYTASVGGYTFSVKDGVATVKYNDVLVAQFK